MGDKKMIKRAERSEALKKAHSYNCFVRVLISRCIYNYKNPIDFSVRYIWWSVYSTVAPLTLQKFRDLGFQFSQKVFGLKEKTPRWKGCTGNANANFGMALSYIYAQKYFNEQAREKVRA